LSKQLLWTAAFAAFAIPAVLIGYRYGITLWDWIKLLIVPVVIAGGGLWFNTQLRVRELHIANERAQDEALQAYLDQMSQLLTDKERPLRMAQPGDDLSAVARARTLTVLTRLDPTRKSSVLRFLYESRLIIKDHVVVDLRKADLRNARLIDADLSGADLSEAYLDDASLFHTDLSGADLSGARLKGADFRYARYALSPDDASLFHTDLSGADLSGASLYRANPSWEQLSKAASLQGAIMPDGQTLRGDETPNGPTFEDWLKDKKRGNEDAEKE